MKKLKLYLETSVWGHYYADDAKAEMEYTKLFFKAVNAGYYDIYISFPVIEEIEGAEPEKKFLLRNLINKYNPVELDVTPEAYRMANKYISGSALPRNSYNDAFHAAIATVYSLDALVSWNCKHLANLNRKAKINGINIQNRYRAIDIITPMEVMYSGK